MEQNMEPKFEMKPPKKKKGIIILCVFLGIMVVAAAFLGGRLLNGGENPLGTILFGDGGMTSASVEFVQASELPTTLPDVEGIFVDRQDNTITVQEYSTDASGGTGGGVAISASGDTERVNLPGASDGPKVEVVVTDDTRIYVDATSYDFEPGDQPQVIEQVVILALLDDLSLNGAIAVWGRKSGDRVIADIIMYWK